MKLILLLCAILCLPATDYEAGIAKLGGEVATSLSTRKDKLELSKDARLDIPSLTELFKLLKAKLPPDQQNMAPDAIAKMADRLNGSFDTSYAETIKTLREYPNADPAKAVRYVGCAFRSAESTRCDGGDAGIEARLVFAVPVKDGQDTLRLDARISRIGERFMLVEVGDPEFKSP